MKFDINGESSRLTRTNPQNGSGGGGVSFIEWRNRFK